LNSIDGLHKGAAATVGLTLSTTTGRLESVKEKHSAEVFG